MFALHESVDLVHSWQGLASLIIWFLAEIKQARANIFIRVMIWKKHVNAQITVLVIKINWAKTMENVTFSKLPCKTCLLCYNILLWASVYSFPKHLWLILSQGRKSNRFDITVETCRWAGCWSPPRCELWPRAIHTTTPAQTPRPSALSQRRTCTPAGPPCTFHQLVQTSRI